MLVTLLRCRFVVCGWRAVGCSAASVMIAAAATISLFCVCCCDFIVVLEQSTARSVSPQLHRLHANRQRRQCLDVVDGGYILMQKKVNEKK